MIIHTGHGESFARMRKKEKQEARAVAQIGNRLATARPSWEIEVRFFRSPTIRLQDLLEKELERDASFLRYASDTFFAIPVDTLDRPMLRIAPDLVAKVKTGWKFAGRTRSVMQLRLSRTRKVIGVTSLICGWR